MQLYCSVNENVWGYDELLSRWSFIGASASLWCWGSPRDRLNGTVNHETEPVSPMLSRLTVPVWDMCFLIVVGTEKLLCCQTSWSWGKAGALNPTSLPLFPICPSPWTEADDRLEGKMDGGSKQALETERTEERVRERCMAAHIASDRMTDEGIMEQGYFPPWSQLGSLPAQAR